MWNSPGEGAFLPLPSGPHHRAPTWGRNHRHKPRPRLPLLQPPQRPESLIDRPAYRKHRSAFQSPFRRMAGPLRTCGRQGPGPNAYWPCHRLFAADECPKPKGIALTCLRFPLNLRVARIHQSGETDTSLSFAYDCQYLTQDQHQHLAELCAEIGRMLGSMLCHPEPFLIRPKT